MGKRGGFSFACKQCGQAYSKWQGQCSSCGEWNCIGEEAAVSTGKRPSPHGGAVAICQRLGEIREQTTRRLASGLDAFDDLVGGGLVPGAITLIGGEPGVGKSTFMLQLASRLTQTLTPIAYVSGEESLSQIKLRAERLRIGSEQDIILLAEQNIEAILGCLSSYLPRLLVIDSIQTMFTSCLETTPGSVGQIRECASILTKFGKERDLPVMIIGHVTKDGAIAGPKILEHIVDTVLYFEGEPSSQFRILRSFKNRFGATGEVAVFQMTSNGLLPVANPSDLFVSRNRVESPGVVIVPLLEGSRSILAELQALVTHSFLSMPRRVVSGLDANRLNLVLAVLEKHAGFKFYNKDVFANVAGGLRLSDPSGDLGLALALVGSLLDQPIPRDLLPIGELTLSGEIRPVAGLERRVNEGRRFGFKRFLTSEQRDSFSAPDVVVFRSIRDAISAVFPKSSEH